MRWQTHDLVSVVVVPWSPVVADSVLGGAGLLAVDDPGRTRTVFAAIAFLVAIGVGLLVLAGWLVRSTRVDPEVLAPLEMMGERGWRSADPVLQRRRLDEVRPEGAEPLARMAPPPDADPEFERGPTLGDFSDFDDLLRGLGVELDEVASTVSDDDLPANDHDGLDDPHDPDDPDEPAAAAESGGVAQLDDPGQPDASGVQDADDARQVVFRLDDADDVVPSDDVAVDDPWESGARRYDG